MSEEVHRTCKVDSGLLALTLLLRAHGSTAEVECVRDLCGANTVGVAEMLRCARKLGFRAYTCKGKWKQLASTPLPAIACLREGGFLSIMKVAENEVFGVRTGLPPG